MVSQMMSDRLTLTAAALSDKSDLRIQFFVKTSNGSTISITDLSCLSKVANLKWLISKKESIPSECQHLVV